MFKLPSAIHFEEPLRRSITPKIMASLEGTKTGKRCVILGSAPSVSDLDLSLIKDDYIFSLNKAYLLKDKIGRNPDATIATNIYAVAEYGKELCESALEHVFLSASAAGALNLSSEKLVIFSQWDSPNMEHGFFQFDGLRPLYQSGTVAHTALQLAVWMGFDEIVMVGVDLSFSESVGHFYISSSGEDCRTRSTSQRNAERMIAGLSKAHIAIKLRGGPDVRRITVPGSCNPLPDIEMSEIYRANTQ